MRLIFNFLFYSQILITVCWAILGVTGIFLFPILMKDQTTSTCTCVLFFYIIPLVLNIINIKVLNNSLNDNHLSVKNLIFLSMPFLLSIFLINCLFGG